MGYSRSGQGPEQQHQWLVYLHNFYLQSPLYTNIDVPVDDFVQQLLFLPAEAEIISDSVYANSQTLDGRRFAEEFIRRRKLADKGIVESVSPGAFGEQKGSGGWSEVAKKGSAATVAAAAQREEESASAAFKVVAPRKKGKR